MTFALREDIAANKQDSRHPIREFKIINGNLYRRSCSGMFLQSFGINPKIDEVVILESQTGGRKR